MLSVRNVGRVFENGLRALDNVSLEIEAGEIVAVVGGSGCGKSTLLRLIAGLDQPSEGSVRVDDDPIRAPHPAVGLVFQEPRLLPWLSVAENVGFALAGIAAEERRRRVAEILQRVGLAAHAGDWPRELSGGMAQRAALARALVARPRVLLLDEPFSALDALTRASLQEHLIELWTEVADRERPTLLLVTHDIEEALLLADRVIVFQPRPGRIHEAHEISLARPRDRDSAAFETARRRLRASLDRSFHAPAKQPAYA